MTCKCCLLRDSIHVEAEGREFRYRKYNAIVDSGIPILKRYDIPEHLIPPDSRVESESFLVVLDVFRRC